VGILFEFMGEPAKCWEKNSDSGTRGGKKKLLEKEKVCPGKDAALCRTGEEGGGAL